MLQDVFKVAYALFIPLVPLFGFSLFKQKGNIVKQYICLMLFVFQIMISGYAVYYNFF